jgi:hypothetical protein
MASPTFVKGFKRWRKCSPEMDTNGILMELGASTLSKSLLTVANMQEAVSQIFFILFLFLAVLQIEPRSLSMLRKHYH